MRPTVLVIEDDAATRTLLSVVLSRAGFEVDSVASGSDALALLSTVRYSAITVDLYMHGVSGYDLLAFVAEHQPDALARIVVVSAAPAPELEQVRRRYDVASVVRKPFDLKELMVRIKSAAASDGASDRDLDAEFCRRSILLGAKTGIVLFAQPARRHFDVVTSYGFAAGTLDRFLPISVDAPYPICKAYRLARDIWISSVTLAAAEYPLLSTIWEAAQAQALITLPLMSGDLKIGSVGWAFREARAFDADDRAEFASVARFLSDTLADAVADSASG